MNPLDERKQQGSKRFSLAPLWGKIALLLFDGTSETRARSEADGKLTTSLYGKAGSTSTAVSLEADGSQREQLVLMDPTTGTQVNAAGDQTGVDKGALHVKLKGGFFFSQVKQERTLDEILGWLKVIAFHLAELRVGAQEVHTHIYSPNEIPDEDYGSGNAD